MFALYYSRCGDNGGLSQIEISNDLSALIARAKRELDEYDSAWIERGYMERQVVWHSDGEL